MAQKLPTLLFRGESTPVIDFAFSEIRHYLGRMPSPHNLRQVQLIVLGGPTDSFEFRVEKNLLQIVGSNDRSCLYGVYAFLEALGWRFAVPGEERFDAAGFRASAWQKLSGKTQASFDIRGLALRTPSLEEAEAVVDWMGKNRLNSLFVGREGGPGQLRELLPDLQCRGIRAESGGHILDEFLPLDLFQAHPEYFRIKEGQRRQDGNFCTARFGTLQVITAHALQFLREAPGVDVFHFWADDVEKGSWCECDICKTLTPAEQLLIAVNAIADALTKERPAARLSFPLYHDTLEFPDTLKPRENVLAVFAPRQRCYRHGIGDPNCPRNAWFASRLLAADRLFGDRLAVHESYGDATLWRCLGIAIPTTILADLAWYHSKRVNQILSAHCGRFSNWACPLNAYVFARGTWDVEAKRDSLVTQFCHARYGSHSGPMLQCYFSHEQASLHTLTYDGYGRDSVDLRDPPGQPAGFAEQHISLLDQAILQTETALAKLPTDPAHKALRGERLLLELNRDNLRALLHQMRGRQHELRAPGSPEEAGRMQAEYEAARVLSEDLQRRFGEVAADWIGASGEAAVNQFKHIAELLQSAHEGRRQGP